MRNVRYVVDNYHMGVKWITCFIFLGYIEIPELAFEGLLYYHFMFEKTKLCLI